MNFSGDYGSKKDPSILYSSLCAESLDKAPNQGALFPIIMDPSITISVLNRDFHQAMESPTSGFHANSFMLHKDFSQLFCFFRDSQR